MLFIYSHMMRGLFTMDKCIIVNIDMFSKKNKIFICSDIESPTLIGNYSVEELPQVIVDLARGESIYSVKIIGANKFSQLIEFGIAQKEMTKYNENKIKVEVI